MTDPHITAAVRRFATEGADHAMEIVLDDDLHRHLRFRHTGPSYSGYYWFDLITVPGTLIFQGDGQSFVFSRLPDMFEFFRGKLDRVDPHYWAAFFRAHVACPRAAAPPLGGTPRLASDEQAAQEFERHVHCLVWQRVGQLDEVVAVAAHAGIHWLSRTKPCIWHDRHRIDGCSVNGSQPSTVQRGRSASNSRDTSPSSVHPFATRRPLQSCSSSSM